MALPHTFSKIIIPAAYSCSEEDLSPKNRCSIPNECPGAPRRQSIHSFTDAASRSKRKISCLRDAAAEALASDDRAPMEMPLAGEGGIAVPETVADGSPIRSATELLLGLQQPVPQATCPVEASGHFTKITYHTFVHQGTCYKQTDDLQQALLAPEDPFMRSFKRMRGSHRISLDSNASSTNADMGFDVLEGQADSDDHQDVELCQRPNFPGHPGFQY